MMGFPILLFALGVLGVVFGQQRPHFTRDGQSCIKWDGKPALCNSYGYDYTWCWTEKKWNYCIDEVCSVEDCDANSECYWDGRTKKRSCKCRGSYVKDSTTRQCSQCTTDDNCLHHQACRGHVCDDPCINYCKSPVATCNATNHLPQCFCPIEYNLLGQTICERKKVVSVAYVSIFVPLGLVVFMLLIFVAIYMVYHRRKNSDIYGTQENVEMQNRTNETEGHKQVIPVQDVYLSAITGVQHKKPVYEDNEPMYENLQKENVDEEIYQNA